MRSLLKSGIAALVLVAATAGAANAAVGLSLNFGDVDMGYSDGYWDHGHHWHRWHGGDAARFRAAHAEMYHGWRHNDRHHH